jgi:tricorn protease
MKRAHAAFPSLLILLFAIPAAAAPAEAVTALAEARLLRFPDIHGDTVVFSHAGDLWSVPASGGMARRLTSGEGLELFPRFSPDGKWIAFTGQYDGSLDVYVMPASGGEPRRLTWYPSQDNNDRMGFDNMVLGWTPDGKILFRGQRGPIRGFIGEPYVVSPEGGPVGRFPLPESGAVSFSGDGTRIAYTRIFRDFRSWKRYKGGMAQDVFVYDLRTKSLERVTDWPGTDTQPMWIGDAIYFLSDRENWKLNLWKVDVRTKAAARVTNFTEYDVKWPHAGSGKIVFENGGYLYVLDPAAGTSTKLTVTLPDDRKLARPRWVKVEDRITSVSLAPGGLRAAVTARGDVFTVPAENGTTRNVTRTEGVREKNAVWSPDGKWLAFFSDATGEEELQIAPEDGKGPPVALTSGSSSWSFPPVWSPDSKKLAFADRAMHLWVVDVATKQKTLVDTATIWEISGYAFAPDSRWLAYRKQVDTDRGALFLWDAGTKVSTQVTPSVVESDEPVFDPEGEYLFFLSDRDIAPMLGEFELSFTVNRATRPYALLLKSDGASPFAPRSDEAKKGDAAEEVKKDAKGEAKKEEKKVPFRIDLAGLADRVVAFPVPPGDYGRLTAAKGKLFWLSFPPVALTEAEGPAKATLQTFDLEKRKVTDLLTNVEQYALAPDGSRLAVKIEKAWAIVEPKEGLKPGDGKLDLSGLALELDPPKEWAQIFRETWRLYRDFFYVPDMGKIDWTAIRKRYEPLVARVSHRIDLNYVLAEMAAELGSGHAYVGGGDYPKPQRMPVGTLGADLVLDETSGRWKIARILEGQNWNEKRRSPLTEPGVKVSAGDYLLAIDGRDLTARDEPYRFLAGTVGPTGEKPVAAGGGKSVTLLVNGKPEKAGAHEIVVRPMASEKDLRYYNWVEENRRRVEKATNGRVGYIHIPDMGGEGLTEFIRQYYSQLRKEGLIVDVRANGGGFVSEIILERLRRSVKGMNSARNARPGPYPSASFNGPMVALISEYSASDGDIFPYYFREYGLGPLIGKRTWGGVVGIRGLGGGMVDGGYTHVPEFATYSLGSEWVMENEGVSPDIEVDNLPADEMAGKDAQLERGIEEILKRIKVHPAVWPPEPKSPDLANPVPKKGG